MSLARAWRLKNQLIRKIAKAFIAKPLNAPDERGVFFIFAIFRLLPVPAPQAASKALFILQGMSRLSGTGIKPRRIS
ncbi:hypothetical protein RY831_31960 [Noviherbaspirillum sp. CPCC 100848]|uniref:Uncharacterized protein n=1 Tax=Noviherbaspirillum album TaxID=3080276 RepID=A0ABU6JJ70_9BURK|nr:hypothetical protein [Noviherbaspirillum sp. CPCC 100848]MEC4723740.1 hypothetical protein [Noviherbaspirillum sp. CPCC 100848]